MSNLKQANCPSCQTTLRFKPTQASLFAITCPSCGTNFQIRNTPAPTSGSSAQVNTSEADASATNSNTGAGVVVKAELLDDGPTSDQPARPMVAKALKARPVLTGQEDAGSSHALVGEASSIGDSTLKSGSLDEHLPEFAAFDASDSGLATPGAATGSSFTAAAPRRSKKSSPWKWVAIAGGGLSCCGLIAAGLVLMLTDAGSSLFSAGNSPAGVIAGHNQFAAEYQTILESVKDDSGRKWAAKEIAKLNDKVDSLVLSAANMPGVKLSELPKEDLSELRSSKYALASNQAATDLRRGRPLHDPLVAEMSDAEDAFRALEAAIAACVTLPGTATGPAETVLADGIEVEEQLVRSLAKAFDSQLPSTIEQVQSLTDRLNEIAERQSQSGPLVGSMEKHWGTRESNLQSLREYLIDRIKDEMQPDQPFFLTLKDFEFVEDRFDQSLFKYELETLSSTSSSRVEGLLQGQSVHPKDSVASAYAASKKQELLTLGSVSNVNTTRANRSPNIGRIATRSTTQKSSDANDDTSNSDRYAASSMSEPYPPQNQNSTGRFDSASNAHSAAATKAQGQNRRDNSSRSVPRGADLFKDLDSSLSSSSGSTDGSDEMDDLPSRLKPAAISGDNSLTVRIFNSGTLDGNAVRRRIASAINASTSYVSEDSGGLVLSFTYRGPLADVARHITDGTIELSDSQSRTIFVQGDR